MYRDDLVRVRHMLDYARKAIGYAAGHSRTELDADELRALGLTRCIEIVGEAASQTTSEFRSEHSQIPWQEAIGMRNRLIHAYFSVNLDVLWATVVEDLPPLVEQLERLIPGPPEHR